MAGNKISRGLLIASIEISDLFVESVIPAQAGIPSATRGSAETKDYVAADAALAGCPPARE
jgi:hypothetical protein